MLLQPLLLALLAVLLSCLARDTSSVRVQVTHGLVKLRHLGEAPPPLKAYGREAMELDPKLRLEDAARGVTLEDHQK